MDAFAGCLAENGVTLPERSGGPQCGQPPAGGADGSPPAPEGVDADTWAAALKACGDAMPTPPDGVRPEES